MVARRARRRVSLARDRVDGLFERQERREELPPRGPEQLAGPRCEVDAVVHHRILLTADGGEGGHQERQLLTRAEAGRDLDDVLAQTQLGQSSQHPPQPRHALAFGFPAPAGLEGLKQAVAGELDQASSLRAPAGARQLGERDVEVGAMDPICRLLDELLGPVEAPAPFRDQAGQERRRQAQLLRCEDQEIAEQGCLDDGLPGWPLGEVMGQHGARVRHEAGEGAGAHSRREPGALARLVALAKQPIHIIEPAGGEQVLDQVIVDVAVVGDAGVAVAPGAKSIQQTPVCLGERNGQPAADSV
jgi:hypothetical protein